MTNVDRKILTCVSNGMTTKEIADRLKMPEGSVETNRIRLYGFIGVRNGPEAVAWGFRNGHLK